MQFSYKLFFVFFFNSFFSYSQIEIKGIVKDSTNVIGFANVFLTNLNNEILTGTITDENGVFNLPVQKGKYKLTVSFIGYVDWVINISPTSNLDLGVITLIESSNRLDEVVVVGHKPIIQRKVDRLVFNVQNSTFLKGSDGIEVLNRTPRIITNNDKISILGKDNVRILINNRFTKLTGSELTAYLQSLTTKDISKIEVITNPSAKYEAEGNTGIINIVLKKKQADYYSGSIRAIYKPATFNAGEIIGSFNIKKGKWLLSTSINRAIGTRELLQNSTIDYPIQKWIYDNIKTRDFNNVSGRLVLDYMMSNNTIIGLQYSGGLRKNSEKSSSKTYIHNNSQNVIDSVLTNKTKSDERNYNHAVNGHFQTNLDTLGKNLSINLDYYDYNKETEELFESFSPHIFQSKDNNGINSIKSYSGKIDLELPYKFSKIETGIKASAVKNNSSIRNFDIISGIPVLNSQSNKFEYIENNQAIYLSASKKFNSKWEIQLGLRLESTQTKGYSVTLNETTKNDYIKLFPTIYFSKELNKNSTFTIDYGKRIKRPYFFQLNPFRYNSDIYSYTVGNPLLKPSFIDNIQLTHSYKNLLETSLYYKHIENGFFQITILHPNNIQQIIPKNYFNSDEFGITESISFNITKFWKTSNNIYVYYMKARSTIPEVKAKNSGLTAYLDTNNTFILNNKKTLFASINYWYQFPEASDLDNANAYSQLDINFKAFLFNKRLILNISGTDLLKTNRPTYTSYNSENIKTTFSNYYDNRRLNLSLTYSFGNNKIREKGYRGSNQSEKRRIN